MDGPVTITSGATAPINVYRVKPDEHIIGWVLLCLLLAAGVIIFMLLWIFSVNDQHNQPPQTLCFGSFGVITGIDADAVNLCGTNKTDPCIFGINSIADAETQCNTLRGICNAFTFNSSNSTMKIVQANNTFASSSTNLFIRQSGAIS